MRGVAALFCGLGLAAGAGRAATKQQQETVEVMTPFGPLVGISEDGVERFVGIRYATAERFMRSEMTAPWGPSALDATAYGPSCHQSSGGAGTVAPDPAAHPGGLAPPPAEDCLFVNAYRRGGGPARRVPVMIWVHGGGFCTGAGATGWTEGSRLAAREDVLVITLNYRLGPLGFASDGREGGAHGLWDVITAVAFARAALVEGLGGDLNAVTLFGESSGGVAVCALSASPAAAGLFRRAIIQSGPCVVDAPRGWGPGAADEGVAATRRFLDALGASSLADARRLDAAAIQWAAPDMGDPNFPGWWLDATLFPSNSSPATYYFSNPPSTHVSDFIIGTTSKDGTAAFYGHAPLANVSGADAYLRHLTTAWGAPLAAKIKDRYSLERFEGDVSAAFIQADADHYLICPTRAIAASLNAQANAHHATRRWWWWSWWWWWGTAAPPPAARRAEAETTRPFRRAFRYVFAHWNDAGCDASLDLGVADARPADTPSDAPLPFASHGSDVSFAFGTDWGPDLLSSDSPTPRKDCPYSDDGRALSDAMMDYWGSFARHGRPHHDNDADAWRLNAARALKGDADGGVANLGDFKAADCAFWASVEDDVKAAFA